MIVVYNGDANKLKLKHESNKNKILGWLEFLDLSKNSKDEAILKQQVKQRISRMRPG